ncbi:MAG TPA: GAF domain-containing protein [Candidatus Hydrogenedentes bacterium]|nr:GAF domain-containing protein [Candidatus Hydrogenedentota bacterium]HIJ73954.1 GAF domain-containing protein [Candidatus Hydrogenedentota bacterium]
MPQIVIEQPGVPPKTVPIASDEMHLGRAEDNDVMLVADEVSRHHAKICRRGQNTVLIDLNSLNGTYVNRQRIKERLLSHMDEIWFGGKCRAVFRNDTVLGTEREARQQDSTVIRHLDKIRAEMDRVGNSLTLISKRSTAPAAAAIPSEATAEDVVAMSRAFRRLDALHKASTMIASEFDLDQRLAKLLDLAIEVMEAERGFVMLRDDESGGLTVSVAREMGRELEASSPSMGIAGRAAIDGEPVLMEDAGQDEEFGLRESIIRQQIVSAMCVPLRIEGRILGSMYVDTRKAASPFSEEDLELFSAFAAQSAMAIDNVRLHEQMVATEKKRDALGRFLSPSIVEAIMKKDEDLVLGGQKRVVTTLFADIRGFTPLAERLSPVDLVELLNEHFTAMTEIVFEHEGTLDKYNGDEVMAVFGAPIATSEDIEVAVQAVQGVRAALAMQCKNAELNAQRRETGRPTFEIGIGIDTGEVIAGNIGSPKRMDFTVVGDHVNTASRLCSLAKAGQVVTGPTTYQAVKEYVEARAVGEVMLKGKGEPVAAFEVFHFKDAAPPTPR